MTTYREIPKDKILKFKATPGFKGWKPFFSEESISHPAKMNLNLLRHILGTYTEKGDVVLDPMAGTGSTVILASSMGRHGVAVEYEAKFCKMIEENIHLARSQSTLTPKGRTTCIHGDARELSRQLIESDVIISSPPYGNRLADVAIQDGDPARMGYRQTVDVVLTSPPYGSDNANLQGREDESAKSVLALTGMRSVDLTPENLGSLKYGDIDAVVMSPPYENSMNAKNPISTWSDEAKRKWWENYRSQGGGMGFKEFISYQERIQYSYSSDSENIGNLKSENYLEAMLQVYQECYKVLKPLGKIVLVTKNFLRDKQVVRLDLDTIKLCESVGFKPIDHLYFKLPKKSFWKILYEKKYPNAPVVKYEDILIFEKNGD